MSRALVLFALLAASVNAAAQCPDFTSPANPPAFTTPTKKSFRHLGSKVLVGLYSPWHMVHDEIVADGQSASVTAKFDYSAVLHKDLEDEYVQAYLYGSGMSNWEYLGRYLTNSDGKISVSVGNRAVGEYRLRFVVEGDLSQVDGYLSVVNPQRPAVLFDVDGTLTINDFEAYADYVGVKTAQAYYYAPETVRAYRDKGYQLVFLTARPYWVTKEAREWFDYENLPQWHYRSNADSDSAQVHKTKYIKYLREQVGLNIVRAYGNATTDIAAYADGGIAKADTWIIGPHAGEEGTQALGSDYSYHFSTVLANTASARCN
ncbi:conserved exported hypothetical protein [Pseudomonas sp. 8Z]|uniref:lipin/Ned1/Smp2 family protein n=1 Tax=Pseudomonas sp. 8Z TaxID=2653166 RepID=UPI0012F26193|nr:haloacid dehalogenase [Pseudomonas sp. 8Z]VXC60389.1 conserved exported hypothetical protein [Pseudomonas sp. 8Z]